MGVKLKLLKQLLKIAKKMLLSHCTHGNYFRVLFGNKMPFLGGEIPQLIHCKLLSVKLHTFTHVATSLQILQNSLSD